MSSTGLKTAAGKSRVKAARLSVNTSVASLRVPTREVMSADNSKPSNGLASRGWRSPEDTGGKSDGSISSTSLKIRMLAGDISLVELQSPAESVDWRKPQPAAAWETVTSAPPTKTRFTPDELKQLTSKPLIIKDVRHVVEADGEGNIIKVPGTFACEVTSAEMKYIAGGMQGLSLAEMKRLQRNHRLKKPSMEWDVEELRKVMGLSTPLNRATLIGPRRSASVSPEFLTKSAGERHLEVNQAKELEKMMEADPAIESINGVESPKRRNRPTKTEAKRFEAMCGRLQPPMSGGHFTEKLHQCQTGTVSTAQNAGRPNGDRSSDSGYVSHPKLDTALAAPSALDDSGHGSPGNGTKLNPAATEFHSFCMSPKKRQARGKIVDVFPEAMVPPPGLFFPGSAPSPPPNASFGPSLLPSPPFTATSTPPAGPVPSTGPFNTFAGNTRFPIGPMAQFSPPNLPVAAMPLQAMPGPIPPANTIGRGLSSGKGAAQISNATRILPQGQPSLMSPSASQWHPMVPRVSEPGFGGSVPMPFRQAGGPSGPPAGPRPFFPVTQKPRDHDPLKQQQYEAYLEWRKANEPGFATSCKNRQARRFARQHGASVIA